MALVLIQASGAAARQSNAGGAGRGGPRSTLIVTLARVGRVATVADYGKHTSRLDEVVAAPRKRRAER